MTAASAAFALILCAQSGRSAAPEIEMPAIEASAADVADTRTPIRRADSAGDELADRSSTPSLASSLAVLGLILGGVYVALNWLRRRQLADPLRGGAIELLASQRLDAQTTLHLVRIGPRVLALGSSPTGARTLAAIDDPEEIAVLVSASAAVGSPRARVRGRTTLGRRAPVSAGTDDDPALGPARSAASRSEAPA